MQVYDGKLYVGTFDASSMLECVGQFVNGNLLTRTPAQGKTQWEYLKTLMKALQATDPDGNGNPDTLGLPLCGGARQQDVYKRQDVS